MKRRAIRIGSATKRTRGNSGTRGTSGSRVIAGLGSGSSVTQLTSGSDKIAKDPYANAQQASILKSIKLNSSATMKSVPIKLKAPSGNGIMINSATSGLNGTEGGNKVILRASKIKFKTEAKPASNLGTQQEQQQQ